MNDSQMIEHITSLSYNELLRIVFERLHSKQSIGPEIDYKVSESPIDWLISMYHMANDGLRDRISTIVDSFILDIVDLIVWPNDARHNLLDFIIFTGIDSKHAILLLEQKLFISTSDNNVIIHAELLKCCLATGRHFTPDFLLEHLKLLGPDFGALIFSGLLSHGIDVAAIYLSQCVRSDISFSQFILSLPSYIDEYGATIIGNAITKDIHGINADKMKIIIDSLKSLGWVDTTNIKHCDALWTEPSACNDPAGTWENIEGRGIVSRNTKIVHHQHSAMPN